MGEKRQRRRALAAAALVAGMLGMVAVPGLLQRLEEGPAPEVAGPARASPLVRAVLGGETAWEEVLPGYRAGPSAPAWFVEELFAPEGARESYASEDGQVLSFVFPGVAADRAEMLAKALVNRGWLGVPSGVEGCATFVKGEGLCRWAMVSCTDAAGWTSVVVRVRMVE